MGAPTESEGQGYDDFYQEFDSPLMQQLRREAYGKDIGQHSWVTVEELEGVMSQLGLSRASRLLDLGCGPCGPLTFIIGQVGCHGSGIDANRAAIAAGRARAAALGLEDFVTLHEADLNEPIPFVSDSFEAVMALDVVLHLRDRTRVFREVARVLGPRGRFLFTDAGVLTGSISNEDVRLRCAHGYTQFVAAGFNERMLEATGFRILDREDHTTRLLTNASGRLAARLAHREELERLEGDSRFERHQRYLDTVIGLSRRGAMSRMMYLAESLAV